MAKPSDQSAVPIIYVVDDDESMRRAMDALLSTVGFNTAVYAGSRDFLTALKLDSPGCLILDIRMPDMSGLELQHQLNRLGCTLPIIFVTGHGDVPMAVKAMKEGAFEFIQKPFRDQDLLDCVNHALKHDNDNRNLVAKQADVLHRLESLTPRERQVMDLVVDGAANKVIAIDLNLSERTVEIHRSKVMEKMGARSIAHLVRLHLTLGE